MENHVLHAMKDFQHNDYSDVVCIVVVDDYWMPVRTNGMHHIVVDPNVDLVLNYSLNSYLDHHDGYYHLQIVVDHANYHA